MHFCSYVESRDVFRLWVYTLFFHYYTETKAIRTRFNTPAQMYYYFYDRLTNLTMSLEYCRIRFEKMETSGKGGEAP